MNEWLGWRTLKIMLSVILGASLGALLGIVLGDWRWGGILGAFIGTLSLVVSDTRQAARLIEGLRYEVQGDHRRLDVHSRLWREVAAHIERSWRRRDALMEEESERMRRLLEALQASPNGVLLLDAQSRITWCNRVAAGHLALVPERDHLQHLANLVRLPEFVEYLHGDNPGKGIHLPCQEGVGKLQIMLFPYGESGERLLLSQDITDIERADRMRQDFVANVSHELRTPLTVLNGFIETLATLPLSLDEQRHYLDIMAQQAQRMQALIDDLLVLARLDGSPLPSLEKWVDVAEIMRQAEHEARALSARRHQVSFSLESTSAIAGAVTELVSALTNLVGNAIRYTPEGGKIQVLWHRRVDGVGEFAVIDTGPGIPETDVARLTERFYRLDRSRSRETGGTGLGLAIVKHVQSRHDGELAIESVEGHGSTFRLIYPAKRVRNSPASQSDESMDDVG